MKFACVMMLVACAESKPQLRLATDATSVVSAAGAKASFEKTVSFLETANPLFSAESCTKMYTQFVNLGGTNAPNDHVVGCNEVCGMVRDMKTYWKSGDMASFACAEGKKFNCAYGGTPPVSITGICA